MSESALLLDLELAKLELNEARKKLDEFQSEFRRDFVQEREYVASLGKDKAGGLEEVVDKDVSDFSDAQREVIAPLTKSLYRKLAKKLHPDLNPDDEAAEESFKECSKAYEEEDIAQMIHLAVEHDIEIPDMGYDILECLVQTLKDTIQKTDDMKKSVSWLWCTSDKNDDIRRKIQELMGIDVEGYEKWVTRSWNRLKKRARIKHMIKNAGSYGNKR